MKKLWMLPLFFCALNLHADYQGNTQGYYYNTNPNTGTSQYYRQSSQSQYPQSTYPTQDYRQQSQYYPQNTYQTQDFSAQSNANTPQSQGYYYSQQPQSTYNTPQNTYDQTPDTSHSDFSYADKYPKDTFSTTADHNINARIRKKFSGWLRDNYELVVLHTDNGIVIIEGFVASDDDRRKLSDEIRNTPGVRSVNNNAQVKR